MSPYKVLSSVGLKMNKERAGASELLSPIVSEGGEESETITWSSAAPQDHLDQAQEDQPTAFEPSSCE